MILSVLLPLFVSWVFLKRNIKRVYLTYAISATIVLMTPVFMFLVKFLSSTVPDTSAFAFDKSFFAAVIGSTLLNLFLTLFFQYIFNKTLALTKE